MARHYNCKLKSGSRPFSCTEKKANKNCLKAGGGLFSPSKCKYLEITNK